MSAKIFISYASDHKEIVRPVSATLHAAGYDVFFDETDLPSAELYDDRIREAVQSCDLFIFMLSPEAVEPGRYTLTELGFAEARWPNPLGRVLVVLPLDTPQPPLPAYLGPLTMQSQRGNLPAEVLSTVRRVTEQLISELSPEAAAGSDEEAADPSSLPGAEEAALEGFQSLDLRLHQDGALGFRLSLSGAADASAVPLPDGADPAELERALWSGAVPVAGAIRRGASTGSPGLLPSEEAVREVGKRLYDCLFMEPLLERIKVPMRQIDRQNARGLRFVINTTDAPALARLPWEFTYDAANQDFVFADPMKPLVRWLDVDEVLPRLSVQLPLRLLIAVASPADQPTLEVGDELAHLDEALAGLQEQGLVQIRRIDHATQDRLEESLLSFRPHLLHFIGHGDFDGDEGAILLESESGATDLFDGPRLGRWLRNHNDVRLVFLNSCLGAAASRLHPFGGVAQALVRHGVPAVIAMQFPIPDATATTLALHFYRYLAAGRPVDEALTAARAYLLARRHEVEWGAPVLTLRAQDCRLFDIEDVPAVVAPQASRSASAPPSPSSVAAPPHSRGGRRGLFWVVGGVVLVALLFVGSITMFQGGAAPGVEGPPPGVEEPAPVVEEPLPGPVDPIGYGGLMGGEVEGGGVVEFPEPEEVRFPGLPPRLPVSVEGGTEYMVRPGDNLWSIAGRRYGDPTRWSEIAAANRAEVPDPARISAGQRLRIPPDASALTPSEYAVREGDSLWRIAARLYGDGRLWPRIHQANAGLVPDPQVIQPGQLLRVPEAP